MADAPIANEPDEPGIDISLADLELSRLDRDYLATINATSIERSAPADAPEPEEEGYQMLDDGNLSDCDEESETAPQRDDDEDASRSGDAQMGDTDSQDHGQEEAEHASVGEGDAVLVAPPEGTELDEIVDQPRDIAIPEDKRQLITSLMGGFQLKGAEQWADCLPSRRT
jgi:hypothetical protein